MSYIYRLAGKNLELAEAEIRGFLESQEEENSIGRVNRIVETRCEPSQLKRLALTHEVSRKVYRGDPDNFDPDFDLEGTFKVKVRNYSGESVDKKKWERVIGDKIDCEVDLDYPDNIVNVYFVEPNNCFIGLEVMDIPRTLFSKRKNQERPFSSPISLDPVLARVLVNLSGVKPGNYLLDPFCGTGGILIEAGLCGIGVNGLDIQEEIVEGARQNLEEYGIINHSIKQGDISNVEDLFDLDSVSVLVSDLPYGKASKVTEEPVEKFLDFIESFEGRKVFMYNKGELGGYEADFSIRVHRSLTRYIYVFE